GRRVSEPLGFPRVHAAQVMRYRRFDSACPALARTWTGFSRSGWCSSPFRHVGYSTCSVLSRPVPGPRCVSSSSRTGPRQFGAGGRHRIPERRPAVSVSRGLSGRLLAERKKAELVKLFSNNILERCGNAAAGRRSCDVAMLREQPASFPQLRPARAPLFAGRRLEPETQGSIQSVRRPSRSSHACSSVTATKTRRPRRRIRSSGQTCSSRKSTEQPSASAASLLLKRTTGFEPATLSLGSLSSVAWLRANLVAKPNRYRLDPLGTA